MSQQTPTGKSPLIEHFVAPIVSGVFVGLVVLVGQFFLQPRIAQKEKANTERWSAKRDCYIQCLSLVNQKFGSLNWSGPDVPKGATTISQPPAAEEVNRCYNQLILFSENIKVLDSFLKCFGQGTNRVIEHKDRLALVAAMRSDLGFEAMELRAESVRFFVRP